MIEPDVAQRITDLERRVRRLDDERAIAAMIARYGPLVDGGAATQTAALWTADGSYTVGDTTMSGRDDVRRMVESADHQRLITRGSAHFLGPAAITVDGDDAEAFCQSLLCVRRDRDGYLVARASINRFRLTRTDAGWRIVDRQTQLLDGGERAGRLLGLVAGPER